MSKAQRRNEKRKAGSIDSIYDHQPIADDILNSITDYDDPEIVEIAPEGAIVPSENGTFELAGLNNKLTPVGFQPDEYGNILAEINQEQWNAIGQTLFSLEGSIQWLIGDWLAKGERAGYGQIKTIAIKLGREEITLQKWARTSREIEFHTRVWNLSHTHHRTVVELCDDPANYKMWLDYASSQKLSVAQLKRAIRKANPDSTPSNGETNWQSKHKNKLNEWVQTFKDAENSERQIVAAALQRAARQLTSLPDISSDAHYAFLRDVHEHSNPKAPKVVKARSAEWHLAKDLEAHSLVTVKLQAEPKYAVHILEAGIKLLLDQK